MIQTHLYARNTETPVYSSPHVDGHPSFVLHEGSWMGVLEMSGNWIHAITVEGEGWVEIENTVVRSPVDLHIVLTQGPTIEYVNSVSSDQ